MTKPRRTRNRAIIAATAAGALLIGGAVVALAQDPGAPVISSGPAQNAFIKTATPTFTVTDAEPSPVFGNGKFLWNFDAAPGNAPGVAAGDPITPASPLSQGTHQFRVLETADAPDQDSPVTTRDFFVDTVAPLFTRVLAPATPSGDNGWYAGNVTINFTCETQTATASGVAACPPDLPLTTAAQDGVYTLAAGATVTDRAGNVSAPLPDGGTLKRDTTDPQKPTLVAPTAITNQPNPAITWSSVDDVPPQGVAQSSGMHHYVLTVRNGQNGGSVVAGFPVTIPQPATGAQVTYSQTPNLVNGNTYNWTVQAVDTAGNTNTSASGVFKVDTTAPNPPAFTAGPLNGQATSDSTPTFTFTGVDGATFTWETRNNLDELVQGAGFAGTGAQATVTLPTLPDGSYTFKVKQTAPNAKSSDFASALFTVDTTAPAAPTISSSPGTTTNPQPSFGWNAAEQDGSFIWEITGVGGIRVQGPGEVVTAAVSLTSPLGAGNYAFRVRQKDRAGNLSDWSAGEPFTIVNPSDPGTNPGPGGTTSGFKPTTRNAKALLPKVGSKVRPASTVLRWKRTKGATLYNLQIFRIDGTAYRKVHSAFPRGLSYRVPKKVLKPGRRYVWRLWPYLGGKKRYTPAPFGISWFDAK